MYPGREIAKDHFLYRIIPHERASCRWWQVPLWNVFGNFEDGLFGEGAMRWWPEVAKERATLWIAVKWWCRNPFANLFGVTMRWERFWVEGYYLRISGSVTLRRFQCRQDMDFWPSPGHTMLRIHSKPPLIMWRHIKPPTPIKPWVPKLFYLFILIWRGEISHEGYIGWKQGGKFGLAWREANAEMM